MKAQNEMDRQRRNAIRWLRAYLHAAKVTTGEERDKYLQAADNWRRWLAIQRTKAK